MYLIKNKVLTLDIIQLCVKNPTQLSPQEIHISSYNSFMTWNISNFNENNYKLINTLFP